MFLKVYRKFDLLVLLNLVFIVKSSNELWCYDCNTNIQTEHSAECNDPFSSSARNLARCPKALSYCMKGVIIYRNVHVTVRGCVPSEKAENYCKLRSNLSDAIVDCFFCNEYACNNAKKTHLSNRNWIYGFVLILCRLF